MEDRKIDDWGGMGSSISRIESQSMIQVLDPREGDTRVRAADDESKRKTRKSINAAGHAHELTFGCHKGLHLLLDDRIRRQLLETIDRARANLEFEVWAYALMPNHVHLLIFPKREEYSVSTMLKAIKMPSAQFALRLLKEEYPALATTLLVHRANSRSEYRFWQQGGGYDRNMTSKKAIHASYDYVHDNPVKAGLVERADEWVWSSASALAGKQSVLLPDRLPHMSE